jgi:hypothetical protein
MRIAPSSIWRDMRIAPSSVYRRGGHAHSAVFNMGRHAHSAVLHKIVVFVGGGRGALGGLVLHNGF